MAEKLLSVVIGTGVAGTRHARAQSELGYRTFLYDKDVDKAVAVASTISGAVAITQERGLQTAMADAHLATIATPDYLHTEPAINAIANGARTLLIEKPVTTSLTDALHIQNMADQTDAQVFVGNNYRLTPAFRTVRSLAAEGSIGEVLRVDTTYIHNMTQYQKDTPWRRQQDFLWGGGVHAVDLAIWVGGAVVDVNGLKSNKNFIPDYTMPERYTIGMNFYSGASSTIELDAAANVPVHGTDLVVSGTEGTLRAHNKKPEIQLFDPSDKTQRIINAGTAMTVDVMNATIKDWITGERGDHDPVPTLSEAMHVVYTMNAIERSMQSTPFSV